MKEKRSVAGLSRGPVKKHEYLMYLASVRDSEALALQLGHKIKPRSIEEIRSEFEQEHGSIYINI